MVVVAMFVQALFSLGKFSIIPYSQIIHTIKLRFIQHGGQITEKNLHFFLFMTNFVAVTFRRLIAPMKLKFSQKDTLMLLQRTSPFGSEHNNEHPLVAILGVLFVASIT